MDVTILSVARGEESAPGRAGFRRFAAEARRAQRAEPIKKKALMRNGPNGPPGRSGAGPGRTDFVSRGPFILHKSRSVGSVLSTACRVGALVVTPRGVRFGARWARFGGQPPAMPLRAQYEPRAACGLGQPSASPPPANHEPRAALRAWPWRGHACPRNRCCHPRASFAM